MTKNMPKKITMQSIETIGVSQKSETERILISFFNKKINEIQTLIKEYNELPEPTHETDILTRFDKLKKMNSLRQSLENSYPQMLVIPEFQKNIHITLFNELRKQFVELGVTSMHENAIKAGPPNFNNAPKKEIDPFADLIANLAPEKLETMMTILSSGNQFDKNALNNLYSPKDANYTQFKTTLANYNIEFLGGGNSKNFKITPLNNSNPALVLKVENRLGQTSQMDTKVRASSLSELLTPIQAVRQCTYTNKIGEPATNRLLITTLCTDKDLYEHSLELKQNGKDPISSAIDLYGQMGTILVQMRQMNVVFTDMKNSNWLIEDNQLRIADTKSFLALEHKNKKIQSSFSPVVTSPLFWPKDLKDNECIKETTSYPIDKIYTYMLGKNLYQYLTACNDKTFLTNEDDEDDELDYSAKIFQSPQGSELATLIRSMLNDSDNRPSLKDALATLKNIPAFEIINRCNSLMTDIKSYDSTRSLKIDKLANELNNTTDIKKLEVIESKLKDELNDQFLSYEQIRENHVATIQTLKNLKHPADQKLNKHIDDVIEKQSEEIDKLGLEEGSGVKNKGQAKRILLEIKDAIEESSFYNNLLNRVEMSISSASTKDEYEHYRTLLTNFRDQVLNCDVNKRTIASIDQQPGFVDLNKELDNIEQFKTKIQSCLNIIQNIRRITPEIDREILDPIDTLVPFKEISSINDLNYQELYLTQQVQQAAKKYNKDYHEDYNKILNDIKETYGSDKNINKKIQIIKDKLDTLSNTEKINGSEQMLSLRQAMETINVFKKCQTLIEKIGDYKISDKDSTMKQFVSDKTTEINTADPQTLAKIAEELEKTLSKMQDNSSVVDHIKTLINKYQTDKTFYKIGKKDKGDAIEQAIINIPIEQRGKDILNAQTGQQLGESIATRRGVFRNTTPLMPDGSIDTNKAAQSFRDFKNKLTELKNNQTATPPATPNPEENDHGNRNKL